MRALVAVFGLALAASPQCAPAQAADREFKISTDVDLVLLDVGVRNGDGSFVSGLAKENFKILEDGRSREIRFFGKEDEPVTIGFIVDNSASMTPKREDVIAAALSFINASNPQDEVFLVNFNDKAWLGLPEGVGFSADPEQLRKALALSVPQGRTALFDALALGLEHLQTGRFERKTLVVISDGGDNASRRKFSDVIRKARESTATIYTIALFDPDSQENDIRALARLARQTGGEHFLLRFPAEVVPTCRQVAQDIRQRYTMAYVPDSTAKKGYRKIQVLASDASGHKLRVRARPGYVPRKSGVDSARINSGPEK